MAETKTVSGKIINGVNVTELTQMADSLQGRPSLARFRFRVTNEWLGGGHSRTTVKEFHGLEEDIPHLQSFEVEADEPPVLVGQDYGANPVEHLLHALTSCLTGALVYHAAVRGIRIDAVESTVEGDLDVRGFMGLAEDVRKGYQNIRVKFSVKSDAPREKLEECARFSPVFDVVSRGTNVQLSIDKR